MKNLKKSMDESFYLGIYSPIHDGSDRTIGWTLRLRILYSQLETNMQDYKWTPYVYTVRTIVKNNFKLNDHEKH